MSPLDPWPAVYEAGNLLGRFQAPEICKFKADLEQKVVAGPRPQDSRARN